MQAKALNLPADLSLASKMEELREARSLSSEIVDSGSKLYSLLALEEETKVVMRVLIRICNCCGHAL